MAAVGAACWAMLFGYFAATGRFEISWVSTFGISRAYAGNPLFNLYRYVREVKFLPGFLWFAIPIGALILLGALRDRRALWERQWAMFLAAIISLQIKIAVNGQAFLPHYYQYWLPMLAVGAGWAAGAKMPRRGSFSSWVMPGAGAIVACFLLVDQGRYYLLAADDWSRCKYGASVVEVRDLGRAIRNVLRPEEGLYVHGDCPGLYYYSDHRPPSPVLWKMNLNDTWPLAELTLRRHLAALTTDPPDLIVVEQPHDVSGDASKPTKAGLIGRLFARGMKVDEGRNAQTVLDTLLPDYHPAKVEALRGFSSFRFHILRGGALDRRLN
jgi:hypothetical protein